VLSQRQAGSERVVAYASRKLSQQEKNYCVTRRELLAVVHFMKQFRHHLLGRIFVVRTDHAALQWLRKIREPVGQQARWVELMEEYSFSVDPVVNMGTLTPCHVDRAISLGVVLQSKAPVLMKS